MIPDCISFQLHPAHHRYSSAISSPTRPRFASSIPTPPDAEHIAAFAKSVPRDPRRQRRVADVLERQNRAWGASDADAAQHSASPRRRFRRCYRPAGGTVRRAAAGVVSRLRRRWRSPSRSRRRAHCVPVFWLASEDHDLAEVNQALLLTHDFQLVPFKPTPGVEGSPVANIRFAEGTNELVSQAVETAGRIARRRLPARELSRG